MQNIQTGKRGLPSFNLRDKYRIISRLNNSAIIDGYSLKQIYTYIGIRNLGNDLNAELYQYADKGTKEWGTDTTYENALQIRDKNGTSLWIRVQFEQ